MDTTSKKELENIINEAICSICLEFFTEPVMIDCGHNFCKRCILGYWEKQKGNITCPKCWEQFTQPNTRLNRFAASMVESVRKLTLKPKESEAIRCPQHDEKLKLFCENDKSAVCVVCAVSQEHKDHKISPLRDVTEVYRDIKLVLESAEMPYTRPTEVRIDLNLREPIGPLQYTVWRRMLKIITPVPASLTLDPQTAHPRLILSEDQSQVKRGEWRKVPDLPKRFNFLLSVLASQGFTSGRHYWEVDVSSNTAWDVGAVKSSVTRKAIPQNGIWAVGLWDKEYSAFTGPRTSLSLVEGPKRLGVYLDYEEGQISFYNAVNMDHIYTFSDKFTETIYPYFSTECKVSPLKVVTVQI